MVDVVEMKQAGKGAIDGKKAQTKAFKAKGAALATLCVRFAQEEVRIEEKRGQARIKFVTDIKALTPEGHAEFRAQLRKELLSLTEGEQLLVQAGAMAEEESLKGGYSANSFRVMVSNWMTISIACEAGLSINEDDGTPMKWDAVLSAARKVRKETQQATGQLAEGQRTQGAGRKPVSDYDKALKAVEKLDKRNKVKLLQVLAAALEYSVVAPAAAPKSAGRIANGATQAPVVMH